MVALYPSLMAGDLLDLRGELKKLEPHCAGFHIDVMDFHFVPNITFGFDTVNTIRKACKKRLWVDLLVDYPQAMFDLFSLQPGDILTVHLECKGINHQQGLLDDIAEQLHAKGLLLALAISPKTTTKIFEQVLDYVDILVLMGVQPGFSGQKFSPQTITKLEETHRIVSKAHRKILIGLDGGVDEDTYPSIKKVGVDLVALGSGVFERSDAIKALKWYEQ